MDFNEAVAAAVQAPSLYNSQPWRFRRSGDQLEVRADPERAVPRSDPIGWATRIACGAATMNLRLALAVQGHQFDLRWQPSGDDPAVMAMLLPVRPRPPTPQELSLFRAIPHRHSNRHPFWSRPVPAQAQAQLVDSLRDEEAWLDLVGDATTVGSVSEIANRAERTLIKDPEFAAELARWTRDDDAAVDGVPATVGGPRPEPQDLFPQRHIGDHARAPGRDFEPEPLIAILGTPGDSEVDQLRAGLALQRVLLTMTDLGLAASLISQPVMVPEAREQLRAALGRSGSPQMLVRVGYGEPRPSTRRRPPAEVIDDAPNDLPGDVDHLVRR